MNNPSRDPNPGQSGSVEKVHTDVRQAALLALASGLCVHPPKMDGSKAPLAPDKQWKEYQTRLPTLDELHTWYGTKGPSRMTGIGTICGKVSGNLECFEFDRGGAAYEPFKAAARALGLGELIDRLEAGYTERSPSGGPHWLYRCSEISGSVALAKYESDEIGTNGKPIPKPIIETRGEGGFIINAPSNGKVHPSGGAYVLLSGGFKSIPTITPEERQALFDLARTFDEMPPAAPDPPRRTSSDRDGDLSPGDDFNARSTWADLLEPLGWKRGWVRDHTTYWLRPGKDKGHSATTNHLGTDRLKVFTTSTTLDQKGTHSKFEAYTHIHHGGDFRAAARALREQGYGSHREPARAKSRPATARPTPVHPADPPSHAIVTDDEDLSALSDEELGIIRFETIKERPIRWLWKYRLAMGGLAMMAGDGGIGKSQLLLAIATSVSNGGEWPDGSGAAPVGGVVILSAEDRPEDTIKPRLIAMGANLKRIVMLKSNLVIKRKDRPPTLKLVNFQDRAHWKEVFRRLPECRLFIADPVPSYLGRGVNDSKNIEIRNVLEPFIDEIISPLDICMLGNTHLNKSVDAKTPMHRISGSIAYGTLPRNVHFVVRDPEDPERRFFKQAKCNNAPDDLSAIAFRVEARTITNADGEEIETAVPVFESSPVDINLGDAVNGSRPGKRGPEPKKTLAVAEWLFDYLSDRPGATPLAAVFDAAGEAGLIGARKPDGKWSTIGTLYNAVKLIPSLAAPRQGKRVETLETPVKDRGRDVKHWYLCGADAEF